MPPSPVADDRGDPAPSSWAELVAQVDRLDQALYTAVADTDTPALDGPIARLSDAAGPRACGWGWRPCSH